MIVKERATWIFGSHKLELDNYLRPDYLRWLHVLEIEVASFSVVVELPATFQTLGVTKDARFSNYAIAGGSLKEISGFKAFA